MRNTGLFRINLSAYAIAGAITIALALIPSAQAQTYQVIYNFTGGHDGYFSSAAVTFDRAGNLYGTTQFGGTGSGDGNGGVFQMKKRNGSWVFDPIYSFAGPPDAFDPSAPVTIGPNGTLYGGSFGGGVHDEGAIFNVTIPATPCITPLCTWKENLPFSFNYTDGAAPQSAIIFDEQGNIYGAEPAGGISGCMEGCGVVFKLTPSGGSWTETYYEFTGGSDGGNPLGTILLGSDGNLYGTTVFGGEFGNGTVFKLTPSGSGWTETTIHSFQASTDGYSAFPGLVEDAAGNLYGAATYGGPNGSGSVFELTPSNGSWNFNLLYAFPGQTNGGPFSSLVLANGNLYGTTVGDGTNGHGSVFELTPSGGSWTYTALYNFTGGTDGGEPYGGVAFDASGNLYGTASRGGKYTDCNPGCGVVWEIAP